MSSFIFSLMTSHCYPPKKKNSNLESLFQHWKEKYYLISEVKSILNACIVTTFSLREIFWTPPTMLKPPILISFPLIFHFYPLKLERKYQQKKKKNRQSSTLMIPIDGDPSLPATYVPCPPLTLYLSYFSLFRHLSCSFAILSGCYFAVKLRFVSCTRLWCIVEFF